jgi:hypothetical protein
MQTNLFRQLQLALLSLFLWAGPVGAADIYDCEFVKALYLTDEGYMPNDRETKDYASRHIMIDKISGAALSHIPLFSRVVEWKRIRADSKYEIFKTTGYDVNGTAAVDIYVWGSERFVSIEQQQLTIYFGTCK